MLQVTGNDKKEFMVPLIREIIQKSNEFLRVRALGVAEMHRLFVSSRSSRNAQIICELWEQ
jgi:hypothetical protein